MVSLSNATKSVLSFMLSVYLSLWTALSFLALNTYEAVRVVEQDWTPTSALEFLGLLSVGIPVLVAMLGGTGCVLLITLVATVSFFACAVLALPVAVCCTFGYFAGNGASKLFGMAMGVYSSLMSWIRSTMGGVFGSRNKETNPVDIMVLGFKRSIPKKDLQGAGNKDIASGTDSPAEGSPKISSSVDEKEEKSTSIVH